MQDQRRPQRRVKIVELAHSLGLSIAHVSRALNGYRDVSPATRARVEAEARRIGYVANTAGRRLRTGRANSVGFVLSPPRYQFADPVFLPLLSGIDGRLREASVDLVVTTTTSEDDELDRIRRMVEDERVDAVLFARARPDDRRIAYLIERDFPFSTFGRSRTCPAAPYVDLDQDAMAKVVVERLAAFGHRRIAHINAPGMYTYSQLREESLEAAFRMAGLVYDKELVVEGDLSEAGAFQQTLGLLALPSRPTAIICANDAMAFGALRAIVDTGLRPGRDVSLIGCDNVPMAALTSPSLTSLHIPYEEIGREMADIVLQRIAGQPVTGRLTQYQLTLVPRQSDGPVQDVRIEPGRHQ